MQPISYTGLFRPLSDGPGLQPHQPPRPPAATGRPGAARSPAQAVTPRTRIDALGTPPQRPAPAGPPPGTPAGPSANPAGVGPDTHRRPARGSYINLVV